MDGLVFLEARSLINAARRLFREPRRLIGVVALVFIVTAVVLRTLRPHASLLHSAGMAVLWSIVGTIGILGIFIRLSVPTPPGYFSDPADAIFILPSATKPWQLMLRRYWSHLLTYWRLTISAVYLLIVQPIPIALGVRLLVWVFLYLLLIDQCGLIAERLRLARIPIAWIARLMAAVVTIAVVKPFLTGGAGLSNVFGKVAAALISTWEPMIPAALVIFVLLAANLVWAPTLGQVNWERLQLSAMLRQVRRGERSMADVTRARAALRIARLGLGEKTSSPFRLSGPWALLEAKLRMWWRSPAGRRWIPVLVLAAIGTGYLIGTHVSQNGLPALIFMSYVMVFGVGNPPSMITSSLVVGAPRAVPLLMAEQGSAFLAWVGIYGVVWTAAAVAGLSLHWVFLGYFWILALSLVMTAWKLYIWSWFPETGTRNVVGRIVLMAGGFIVGAVAVGWLMVRGGWIITVPWALVETWLLYRLTLRRLSWAIGHTRINHGE